MDRYTKRLDDGQAVMDCQGCPESWMNKPGSDCTALYCRDRLKDRVAAYEDTGLEPQEIERIVDTYGRGHTLRTESAERLEIIREIPTGRLQDLVHEEAWANALIYDMYHLLLAVDAGIRNKDLAILRPPSRVGAPENGIPFQRQLSKLEAEYDELLYQCCSSVERKLKKKPLQKAAKPKGDQDG